MAISDLTNTSWVLNSSLSTYPGGTYTVKTYNVNITTSEEILNIYGDTPETSFVQIAIGYDSGGENNVIILYDSPNAYPFYQVASGNDTKSLPDTWSAYYDKPFTITGGTDATNSALITWLENNATEYVPPVPDVVVTYDGDEIATMDDSGTKVLKTAGKYCDDDITIEFTKSGGGVTLGHVSIVYDGGTKYYTDSSMTVQTTSGDIVDDLPIGTLIAIIGDGAPAPFPPSYSGVTKIVAKTAARFTYDVYEVTG